MTALTALPPCERCGRVLVERTAATRFSFCPRCELYVCAACWVTAQDRCRDCAVPGASDLARVGVNANLHRRSRVLTFSPAGYIPPPQMLAPPAAAACALSNDSQACQTPSSTIVSGAGHAARSRLACFAYCIRRRCVSGLPARLAPCRCLHFQSACSRRQRCPSMRSHPQRRPIGRQRLFLAIQLFEQPAAFDLFIRAP